MVVGIVIGVVVVALLVLMKWADRRDRARGHRNRSMGEIRSTMRASRMNARMIRRPGGRDAAVSPHEFARRQGRQGRQGRRR